MEIRVKSMITVSLTEQQVQNLIGFVDTAVRTLGLRSVVQAAELVPIFEQAVVEYKNRPKTEEVKNADTINTVTP